MLGASPGGLAGDDVHAADRVFLASRAMVLAAHPSGGNVQTAS
jgi:hypothetical protein